MEEEKFVQSYNAMYEIWRTIRRVERREIKKMGLKYGHARVLRMIVHAQEPMTATMLCAACEKDKAAISRLLSELIARELVYRKAKGDNFYRAEILLTDKGMEAAKRLQEKAWMTISKSCDGVTPEQLRMTHEAIGMIAENIRKMDNEGL